MAQGPENDNNPSPTPSPGALRAAEEATTHLGEDGLPPYPPRSPWPALPAHLLAAPLWVFGYGSLIWHPGFPHVESRPARVHGHHRALCVWSWVYRGSVDTPGLVLGLDRGGSASGVAYRVPDAEREATLAYLLRREIPVSVYRAVRRSVRLDDGRRVSAVTFVVNRDQELYAGRIEEGAVRAIVARARGRRGSNAEYVHSTAEHLEALGIPCPRLRRLARDLPG